MPENWKKPGFLTAESIELKLIACHLLGQEMVLGLRKIGFCSQFAKKPVKTGLANSCNSTVLTQCVIHYFQCFDDGELIFDIRFIKFKSLSSWIQQKTS